jgi:UPF0176 protein
MTYSVILFYKYVTIDAPELLMERERAVCEVLGLTGRVIIATEGINATLEGTTEAIAKYKAHIKKDSRFKKVDIKETEGKGDLFPRLSIKVRPEIVTSHLPASVNPRVDTGVHLAPSELKKWFEAGEDFEIIDMRNDYEYAVGHFKNARPSGMSDFKDLPKVAERYSDIKDKKVITVCTGGVRCEKASAYLKSQGFTNVYQLEGGIHRYMEKYPAQEFLGTLYTFDGRVTMDLGAHDHEVIGVCVHCGEKTERFADCALKSCGNHFIACTACRDDHDQVYCQDHVAALVS